MAVITHVKVKYLGTYNNDKKMYYRKNLYELEVLQTDSSRLVVPPLLIIESGLLKNIKNNQQISDATSPTAHASVELR